METHTFDTHERIITAAYPLFAQRGIRQVSKEEVQRVAGVTGAEFDLEFSSRDDLATECLERREHEWVEGVLNSAAIAHTSPTGRLLAIFDVFDEWFHRDDYEALSRVDELLQMGSGHPLGHANAGYILNLGRLAASLAQSAGLRDPEEFALSWNMLVTGAITNAVAGDDRAAARAKELARSLIAMHQSIPRAQPIDPRDVDNRAIDEMDLYSY
jgi:AcrR family transcriptional regulator